MFCAFVLLRFGSFLVVAVKIISFYMCLYVFHFFGINLKFAVSVFPPRGLHFFVCDNHTVWGNPILFVLLCTMQWSDERWIHVCHLGFETATQFPFFGHFLGINWATEIYGDFWWVSAQRRETVFRWWQWFLDFIGWYDMGFCSVILVTLIIMLIMYWYMFSWFMICISLALKTKGVIYLSQ